jgi:hypothetical protein
MKINSSLHFSVFPVPRTGTFASMPNDKAPGLDGFAGVFSKLVGQ